MKYQVETITPEKACDWLEYNYNNRPVARGHLHQLCGALTRGEWEFNGDPIRFAQDGTLLDGQHRLIAVSTTGVSIESLVIYGLPKERFALIDTQLKRRTANDVFSVEGEKFAQHLATVARAVHIWRNHGVPFYNATQAAPTIRQLQNLVEEDYDIREAVSYMQELPIVRKYMSPRIAGFCIYAFNKSRVSDHVGPFFETFEYGVANSRGDAAIVLRNRLIEEYTATKKIDRNYKTAMVFKAFERYVKGHYVTQLKVSSKGKLGREHFSIPD